MGKTDNFICIQITKTKPNANPDTNPNEKGEDVTSGFMADVYFFDCLI